MNERRNGKPALPGPYALRGDRSTGRSASPSGVDGRGASKARVLRQSVGTRQLLALLVLGVCATWGPPGGGDCRRDFPFQAQRRLHPGRRPRLVRRELLRAEALAHAEHRPAGRRRHALHRRLRRRAGLLADPGEHPHRQVPAPHAHERDPLPERRALQGAQQRPGPAAPRHREARRRRSDRGRGLSPGRLPDGHGRQVARRRQTRRPPTDTASTTSCGSPTTARTASSATASRPTSRPKRPSTGMQANRDRPFFLYFSTNAVHTRIDAQKKHVDYFLSKGLKPEGPWNATYAGVRETSG